MPLPASLITRIPSLSKLRITSLPTNTTHFTLSTKPRAFSSFHHEPAMNNVAVIGCGISGAVCGSALAAKGVGVTVFESGRGPGGRTSRRREITEDGKELLFDHGAPFFVANDEDATTLVSAWEARGLVAEWKENFACFDQISAEFVYLEETGKKYVGVPGMNSICKALCSEPGVEAKFGVTVGKLEWLEGRKLWSLSDLEGESLGHFGAVVATDKIVVSPNFKGLTGKSPPLDLNLVPEFATKLQDIPVHPCFALMLAFSEPLLSIPVKGFSFKNSEILSWAFCDSSKPGRSLQYDNSQHWVLHSKAEYAQGVISRTGLQKPSKDTLLMVAQELFQAFERTGLHVPRPFFMKAHRWGGAFPAISIAEKEKCLWDRDKRLAICGDFCISPSVEGALLSGRQAATNLLELVSSL